MGKNIICLCLLLNISSLANAQFQQQSTAESWYLKTDIPEDMERQLTDLWNAKVINTDFAQCTLALQKHTATNDKDQTVIGWTFDSKRLLGGFANDAKTCRDHFKQIALAKYPKLENSGQTVNNSEQYDFISGVPRERSGLSKVYPYIKSYFQKPTPGADAATKELPQ